MNVCIVGTGYVGLVTAACLSEMGNHVRCVDANPKVVETLRAGRIHIFEPGLEDLVRRNTAEGRLTFTDSLAEGLSFDGDGAEFAFVCVGTPEGADGTCDLCYVDAVAAEIGRTVSRPLIVVNKSTVPVGTADRVRAILDRELSARGMDVDVDVVSNPEFLKEGDAVKDFMKPDRVIVGTENPRSAEMLKALYAPFARSREKLIIMGVKSAEMTKYAANCMLATKISFINEVANICERVGADVSEVRLGIGSDHRIGYDFIYPGVGYGGSCFPKDVKAFLGTARQAGYEAGLIDAVDQVNARQKLVLAHKVLRHFEPLGGVAGKTLALWGLAFKANTDDIREAPALAIIRELTARGMRVRAFDPVARERAQAELAADPLVELVAEQYQALDGADALAVVTDWNQFRNPDFAGMARKLAHKVVFDGRNLYQPELLARFGLKHYGIGR
ncbi:UDPglucose 6-dehydrogenase [Humidesulfovibrio mexicanus]|uniref:UDP-glucose 6-dehydrogenase n=1 Tax=Humidesulfovibrio mexicanus TaxID=147047 RepID=A0A238Z7I9_9BACT|nr:UDP-glucose/GDP-mannose dehydrogenase family protein [Humidesulfovibrio mexicanus]SNR79180.1 UDPglucose 6-dehydrogenase [Humidesulfovibrio mexicanus]